MSQRLTRLITLLQRREDVASAARAQAARAVADARERLADARRAGAQLMPTRPMTAVELQSLRLRGLGATAMIESAHEALEERRAEELEAERDRSVAAVRRRSVERLAERRQMASVRRASAASQRALDELAALRQGER